MRASWTVLVVVGLLVACDNEPPAPPTGGDGPAVTPLTAEDVTARSEVIVDRVVGVSLSSQSVLRDSEAWAFLAELLESLGDDSVSSPVEPPDLPPQAPPDEGESEEVDAAEIAAELNDWLEENVFNQENIESSNGSSVVFRLHGESFCDIYVVCEPCPIEGPCDNDCDEEIDQDCIDLIDEIELRVRATLVGDDALELALLVGPSRVEPVTASLSPLSVLVDTDLAQAKLALEHVLSLMPEGEVELLPRVMQGKLHASLVIAGDEAFAATWAVTQAIAVELDTELGTFEVGVGATDPMLSLVADGVQEMVAFDLELGAVDVALPWALLSEDESDVATALFHLAGLSFGATLSGEADSLTITNIGLGDGPSTMAKDGVTLFQADVNPTAGRSFDLNVAPTDLYDSVLLAVAPELHVIADFNLVHVLADFPELESFLWDETYQVRLSGAGSASVIPVPETDEYDGGLHVATGTLEISSTGAAAPVTVQAGQCLSAVEPDEGDHPLLGSLAATACP